MIRKVIASLLSAFLFCGIFSFTASARSKEIEKQLVEIWRSGDDAALDQYYDEYYVEDGGIADKIWEREEVEAFRNAENKLFVIKLDFDREAAVRSSYGKYFLNFEKSEEYAIYFGKYSVTAVIEDGSLQHRTIDTRERSVYTVKELLRDFGIDDPNEIGLIRGSDCWFDYGTTDRSDLMDYTPGWNEIEGNRYYIKSDGTVLTKSATIGEIRYKFDENGVCQGKYTGYTKSSKGKRYWKNGELLTNKWIKVNGERKYYAGENGYFVTGTLKINGKEYSFDKNGTLKKMPEKKEFPKIEVKFPDGAVYESSDGGANWTKDGEEAQRPLVYAAFEGECPLCWSGDAYLTIYNDSVPSLIEKGVWFLREENGEWIEAEYLEEVEVLAASAYVIEEKAEGRFKIPTELYVPFEGKCRYIHEMHDFDNEIYTISAEFSIVGESMESVSP